MKTTDGTEWSANRTLGYRVAETPAEYVVARPTVYLDTTIPSYLTCWPSRNAERARRERATHEWWNLYRWQFEVRVSDYVIEEAEVGDATAARHRIEMLKPLRKVETRLCAVELAEKLMKECGLPEKANMDAKHVALAATHALKFLLTWNYKHLANNMLRPKLMNICRREGYHCPRIVTPDEIIRLRTHV